MTTTNTISVSPGVYYDMPDPDYRKAAGVSNSMLKVLRNHWGNPGRAKAKLAVPQKDTEAFLFGKALHASLLTPDVKPTWVVLPPDAPKRPTKAQVNAKKPTPEAQALIDWWKKFDEDNKGLGVMEAEGFYGGIRLEKTIEAFKACPLAMEAIGTGASEVSAFAPYSYGGTVLRKMRADFVSRGRAIVDLKTIIDCSLACVGRRDEFVQEIYDRDYDMQAAYYIDLWNDANPGDKKDIFVFIATDWDEDTQTVGIRVMQADDLVLKSGRDKYTEALAKWIECEAAGFWPSYPNKLQRISVPDYIAKKYGNSIVI